RPGARGPVAGRHLRPARADTLARAGRAAQRRRGAQVVRAGARAGRTGSRGAPGAAGRGISAALVVYSITDRAHCEGAARVCYRPDNGITALVQGLPRLTHSARGLTPTALVRIARGCRRLAINCAMSA